LAALLMVCIHHVPAKNYTINGLVTADAFTPTKRKAPLVRGLVKFTDSMCHLV
jgi:hypothetical protein